MKTRIGHASTLRARRAPSKLALQIGGYLAALALAVTSAVYVKKLSDTVTPLSATISHAEPPAELIRRPGPAIVPVAADPAPVEAIETFDAGTRWFGDRPVAAAKTVTMTVTAYSPHAASCAPFDDGQTATLHSVITNGGNLVAADPAVLPMGSMLTIPGYASDSIVPVLDKGGAIKGDRLDVLFPTHEAALEWGVRVVEVTVWEYTDGRPAPNPRKIR
ncbi:MAG: 3D domain-containing protein [Planctomycetota bacterium]